MNATDNPSDAEARRADLLEDLLHCVEQGRAPDLAAPEAPRLLDDLMLLLGAVEGLRAERSQMLGSVLELGDTAGPEAPPPEALPDPFPGEYRIDRFLGQGAFGAVWLAEDLRLGRPVALKALRVDARPAARALSCLRDEARMLGELDHRHIVRVHAWRDAPGGGPYLVLQYVAGGSLADRVYREGPLPWHIAARYIADIGEGLLAVHARGVVHRDVKPANMLWEPQADEALLTDFGVSVRLREPGTRGGTPFYMPPEALQGAVGPGQDVYGLAASLFWLVTGAVPFPGPTEARLLAQARRGLAAEDPRFAALPRPLERLVRAGLAAEPERRPALEDFVVWLRAALNQLLADRVARLTNAPDGPVRLVLSRRVNRHTYSPIDRAPAVGAPRLRDIQLVPDEPDRLVVRTGERLRIEVQVGRPGYVAVFNVGPGGTLNRLYPAPRAEPVPAEPGRLRVGETVLTPPTGPERLIAVWGRQALTVRLDQALGRALAPGPYRSTRDIALLEESVLQLPADEWHVAVVELDHQPALEG